MWHLKMSKIAMLHCSIILGICWDVLFHVFSGANSKKHKCPGLNFAANAANSLALCNQISVLPFLVLSMSLNMDGTILSSNNWGSSPAK